MATPVTSATGGSASSQADWLDGRAWNPRPIVSFTIKASLLVVPLIVGVVAVKLAIDLVSRPRESLPFWTWMLGLIAVSFVASIGTQRALRRFAPLAMLFKMSLVFPDEAPSRFRAAMRTGSTRSLSRRAELPGAGSSGEQAAAEELLVLIARLSRHDRLTRGHVERVRAYSIMLGEQIGLSRSDLDKLNWAALIHDIGKLDVPEPLLNKPDRPTPDEWEVLRTHPSAGHRYVEPLRGWLGDWVDATTQHHERFDGKGYPRGLAGKDISLAGRIVSIADAYDVMTALRSYKKPLPAAQARAELTRNSGTQFDPHLVRSFLEISLGRLRRAIGPIGWLAHLPNLIRGPLTAVASSTTGIVAVGALGVATAAGAAAPADTHLPRHESAAYVGQLAVPSSSSTTVMLVASGEPAPHTTPRTTPPTTLVADHAPEELVGPTVATSTTTTASTTTSSPATTTTKPPHTNETVPVFIVPSPTTVAASPTTIPAAVTTVPPATTIPVTTPPTLPPTTPPTTAATSTTTATTTPPPFGTTVAVDDTGTGQDDKSITVHVLQNDSFGGSIPNVFTLSVVTPPSHGTATVSGANIVYRSNKNFKGIDTFEYSICSVGGSCDQAVVTMTIID